MSANATAYLETAFNTAADAVYSSFIFQVCRNHTYEHLVPMLNKYEHTSQLVSTPLAVFISFCFTWSVGIMVVYEIVSNFGIAVGWWKPALTLTDEQDTNYTSHVYISLNTIPGAKIEAVDDLDKNDMNAIPKKDYEMKFPVVYHMEFGPSDYADEKLGSRVKNLRQRVLEWFFTSQQYYLNKGKYREKFHADHVYLFKEDGTTLGHDKDEEFLVKLGIQNGNKVHAVISF